MMKRILAAGACLVMLAVMQGFSCSSDQTTSPQPSNSPYAGTWVLRHVATVSSSGPCGGDTVGVERSEGPFTISSDGHFTFTSEGGGPPPTGVVSSAGVVSVTIPAHDSCVTGSAAGSCATTDSCAGTYTQGSSHGTWTLNRVTGSNPYAGSWTLTHTKTSEDPGACAEGDSIGVTKTEGPVLVDATGYFTIPDSSHSSVTGTVSAGGAITGYIPADTGEESCPAGSISGSCATTDSCSGTYNKGGNHGTWTMVRIP